MQRADHLICFHWIRRLTAELLALQMSRFLKPVDYNDDEDDSFLVRAKPIDPKFARKLGSYAAGKDFITGSVKSQQELRGLLRFFTVINLKFCFISVCFIFT